MVLRQPSCLLSQSQSCPLPRHLAAESLAKFQLPELHPHNGNLHERKNEAGRARAGQPSSQLSARQYRKTNSDCRTERPLVVQAQNTWEADADEMGKPDVLSVFLEAT